MWLHAKAMPGRPSTNWQLNAELTARGSTQVPAACEAHSAVGASRLMTTEADNEERAGLEASEATLACCHEHRPIPMNVDPGRLVEWRCMKPGRPESLEGR